MTAAAFQNRKYESDTDTRLVILPTYLAYMTQRAIQGVMERTESFLLKKFLKAQL